MHNKETALLALADEEPALASTIKEALTGISQAQVTDDYQHVVAQVAGPVYPQVQAAFPNHLQLIYLVTDIGRRHAWNIVLHGLPSKMEPLDAARLRAKRATQKAKSLLRSAYSRVSVLIKRFLAARRGLL